MIFIYLGMQIDHEKFKQMFYNQTKDSCGKNGELACYGMYFFLYHKDSLHIIQYTYKLISRKNYNFYLLFQLSITMALLLFPIKRRKPVNSLEK